MWEILLKSKWKVSQEVLAGIYCGSSLLYELAECLRQEGEQNCIVNAQLTPRLTHKVTFTFVTHSNIHIIFWSDPVFVDPNIFGPICLKIPLSKLIQAYCNELMILADTQMRKSTHSLNLHSHMSTIITVSRYHNYLLRCLWPHGLTYPYCRPYARCEQSSWKQLTR